MASFKYKEYVVQYNEKFFDIASRGWDSSDNATNVTITAKKRWMIVFKLPESKVELLKLSYSGLDISTKHLIDLMTSTIKELIDKGIQHNYFQPYELTDRGFEPEV